MGQNTGIEWADDTVNGQMGCDGCELYNPKTDPATWTCYAETLVTRRLEQGPAKGWPESFNKPELFPLRIQKACHWPDLTGQRRPRKPWLNNLPRHIFFNDLGDTFTESLPLDWLRPYIPAMAATKHIWMILTKRPERMYRFFEMQGTIPRNFQLGTSLTTTAQFSRVDSLLGCRDIDPDCFLWLSIEPQRGPVLLGPRYLHQPQRTIDWIVVGGESGYKAHPYNVAWARSLINEGEKYHLPVFVKQLGSRPYKNTGWQTLEDSGYATPVHLRDSKGGDWKEWPIELCARMMGLSNGMTKGATP